MLYLLKSKIPTKISISETRLNTSCGWFYLVANSNSGGWVRVAADSVLRLTRVPATGYELRLTLSHGRLEFWRLDTTYSWHHPTADSSSGGWIRLKADSILRLDSSFGGLVRVAADSILRLTRVLYFNISSKFKDLFCKIHHFYGLFSTDWFQLPLIEALAATSRSSKKLQDSSCNWSSCSGWLELRRLIRDLRPIDYLENFDPNTPWYFLIHTDVSSNRCWQQLKLMVPKMKNKYLEKHLVQVVYEKVNQKCYPDILRKMSN